MKRGLILLAALCLPVAGMAQINTLPSAPHLLVKGHAEARYVPDRFTIHLTVDVTNMSPNVARTKVEAHMRQLFKALDEDGALQGQTHASSLSIQPQTDYRDGKTVFEGTDVSRTITASFDSLDKLRAFIAKVPASKEVQISSVDTARSDIDKIRSELRRRAMENSQEAARKIAVAYGMTITGIYSVSEVAPNFAYGIQAGSWGGSSSGGPGSGQTLSAVNVTAVPAKMAANAPPPIPTAMRVGTQTAEQNIYAVYLIAPKKP